MLGFSFELGSDKDSWGVNDFWGDWESDPSERAKWTKEDRDSHLGKTCLRVSKIMRDAKVESLASLQGAPIEATFDGLNTLKSWRILTEVI